MLIYVDNDGQKHVVRGIKDEIAREIRALLPEIPNNQDVGINRYLRELIDHGRTEFSAPRQIVKQYLKKKRMELSEDHWHRPLLLYDPDQQQIEIPQLPPADGLTEQERRDEEAWQSDYVRHYERDRDRDRRVDKSRLFERRQRRIVIPMQGTRSADFRMCDKIARINAAWRRKHKATWHHADHIYPSIEDGKVVFNCDMYLVQRKYHAGFYHTGACAEIAKYTGCKYRN